MRYAALISALALTGTVAAETPAPTPTPTAREGSASVRRVGSSLGRIRAGAADALWFEWLISVPTASFPRLTLLEAAERVNALDAISIDAASTDRVSPSLAKPLDARLAEGERTAVAERLRALAVHPLVYRVPSLGPTDADMRKVFELARAIGVKVIVSAPDRAELAHVDDLANVFEIAVAVDARAPAYRDLKALMAALQNRSPRLGVSVDVGAWLEQGLVPQDALAAVKDRLLAVTLSDRSALGPKGREVALGTGAAELSPLLFETYRLGRRPLYVTVSGPHPAAALDALEQALAPAMRHRVREVAASEKGQIRSGDALPEDMQDAIDAAVPSTAPVAPKKPRKLLVFDLNMYSGHQTIRHGNLLLARLGKKTGAFEPVFSNSLDNLRWENIRKFDAVFLNNVVGMVFEEPEVRAGLLRYVKEGGGLGGVHGTSFAALDWPEFAEMLGAGAAPHRQEPVVLKIDDPASPLNAGFEGQAPSLTDELYRFYADGPYSRDKVHVLLSVDTSRTDMDAFGRTCASCTRPDGDYAVSWIKRYGQGRVFFTPLGHTPTIFTSPPFVQHILAGLQFILGDLEADASPSRPADR
jgi:type 1 glutamine amidotransferase/sugar phosphate isomerase/epimerase